MSGPIEVDTIWRAENSPILVSGEVVIQGGAALSIEAGVIVYMAAGASLRVRSGSLRASGTAAQPIRVLSDRTRQGQLAAPGDWGQWIFEAGTSTATRLDHVEFAHGRGLQIQGASPVLNDLFIRDQLGAAIAIDLASSPSGSGNRASGNTLDGIAVPAGEILTSVAWRLRGIPYVVESGVVSVGAAPRITQVTPATLERGQTVTVTVSGTRLGGISSVAVEVPGVQLTPFPGATGTTASFQVTVAPDAPLGAATLRLLTDAGEVLAANALSIVVPAPSVTAVEPASVLAGAGPTQLTVTGRNFTPDAAVLVNSASIPTTYVSATQLTASLPSQSVLGTLSVQVQVPDPRQSGAFLLSNPLPLAVNAPVPPTVAIEPTPIALPPDGRARDVTVRLSKPDYRDAVFTVSVTDPTKASASPATLTIPAGQTSARVTITPLAAGTASLVLESTTLARVSVPLFITTDFRGVNTAYAPSVGVVVPTTAAPVSRTLTVAQANVGVAVGSVLTRVAPAAWVPGDEVRLVIQGAAIPAGAQVSLQPSLGISLGPVSVAPDGSRAEVTVTTAADAPVVPRRVVVRDAALREIAFADPAAAIVQVLAGRPVVESIEPLTALRGSTSRLLIRGRHLHQGRVDISPSEGLRVDASPVIESDGRSLALNIEVAPDAPLGTRVVRVVTPAGASASEAAPANTLTIVQSAGATVTPVVAPVVGVVVGEPLARNVQRSQWTTDVGVLVGAGIKEVTPNVAVVGAQTTVLVRGAGLGAVTAVAITPATGITLGAPVINGDGTELRFDVTVAPNAALGLRRLVVSAGDRPLTFSRATDGAFLVSAPIPELDSVEPQVLLAGQASTVLTIRGRNLLNATALSIEPADGVTVNGSPVVNAEGTLLTVGVTVSAGASPGGRTVIVRTGAGESSSEARPGNTLRIATQVGPTYFNLAAPNVGVVMPSTAGPVVDRLATSPIVGVQVGGTQVESRTVPRAAFTGSVGVVVGSAAQTMTPDGWLQDRTGVIEIGGIGLDQVTSATASPSAGILLGTPAAESGGTRLSIPITTAPDAPLLSRRLRLFGAGGAEIVFIDGAVAQFGIGALPTLSSVAPIVIEQGRTVTLTVRGSGLRVVTAVQFESGAGLVAGAVAWSQDALGELLTVAVSAASDAVLGPRALRLKVPGGLTSSVASPANTITVIPPQ